MAYRKFHLVVAAALMAVSTISAVRAQDLASDWVEGFNNKARLIAGKASGGLVGAEGAALAGIEISMSPGFKTYWRNPGEAGGVPPEFDFSGSQNVGRARVLYPAPHRTKDKAGENIAYKDTVIFPVLLTPADPAQPMTLNVNAVYGVCKDICIPAEASLSISIPPSPEASDALAAVLKTVPAETANPATDPVLSSWRIEREGAKLKLIMDVANGGAEGDAFLFSADGLYMPMTKKVSAGAKDVYEADLTEGASLDELAAKRISVTLVGAKGQSETFIQLPNDLSGP
jgi:DsbC/DsbD-like thiol-disulfide interchange protein